MNFDEVQIGQMFLYKDVITEGWLVTDKTNTYIKTMYMLNYGGEFETEEIRYNRREWENEDYFKAYVRALRNNGINFTIDERSSKEARL